MQDEELEHPEVDAVEGCVEALEDVHPHLHPRLDVEEVEEGVDGDQEEEEKEEPHPQPRLPKCKPA